MTVAHRFFFAFIFVLLGVVLSEDVKPTVPYFSGHSYLQFDKPSPAQDKTTRLILTVLAKTSTGILFFCGKPDGGFIGLVLRGLTLEFRYNVGLKPFLVRLGTKMQIGKWHHIQLIIGKNSAEVILDRKDKRIVPEHHQLSALHIDNKFLVGGLDAIPPKTSFRLGTDKSYVGCMGMLRINGVNYDLNPRGPDVKKYKKIKGCVYKDVNECSAERPPCGENYQCVNVVGSYLCLDIDECDKYEVDCGPRAECINTEGSFYCQCDEKSHFDGKSCKAGQKVKWIAKLDICKSASCPVRVKTDQKDCLKRCADASTCLMTKYVKHRRRCYLCKRTSLREARKSCGEKTYDFHIKVVNRTFTPEIPKEKILAAQRKTISNWAELLKSWVHLEALCVGLNYYKTHKANTPRECVAVCEKEKLCLMVKYNKRGFLCWLSSTRTMTSQENCQEHYDYYVKRLHQCHKDKDCKQHARCEIEKGHQYCQCRQGFEQIGQHCQDINECERYQDLCGPKARCINIVGSYKCKCNIGFLGNGFICVNEKLPHASHFMANLT